MDIGAQRAGVEIALANDRDPDAARTHASYFAGADLVVSPVEALRSFPSADLVLGG